MLAATFAALSVIPILFLVQLAFIVAFGVLLDTFIVRSLLVPALVRRHRARDLVAVEARARNLLDWSHALVAQGIEQPSPKGQVAGSNPVEGTMPLEGRPRAALQRDPGRRVSGSRHAASAR